MWEKEQLYEPHTSQTCENNTNGHERPDGTCPRSPLLQLEDKYLDVVTVVLSSWSHASGQAPGLFNGWQDKWATEGMKWLRKDEGMRESFTNSLWDTACVWFWVWAKCVLARGGNCWADRFQTARPRDPSFVLPVLTSDSCVLSHYLNCITLITIHYGYNLISIHI